jgi:PAS domain S-box-containing protein
MTSLYTYRPILKLLWRYMFALGLVGACVLLCLGIPKVMALRPFLAFWPVVVVAAEFGGIGPGLLATVASILCVHFILNPVFGGLNLFDWIGMTTGGIFFVGASAISIFIGGKWNIQSLQRLQAAAMQSATNGIALTDAQGALLWANPAFCTMTGYTSGEIIGKIHWLLVGGEQSEAFWENLWSTVLQREVWHGELVGRRKDGTTYVEERSVTPVADADGRIINCVIIMQDITERKFAEEEQEKLQAQLIQVQKMESVGRLAGGVAHDFNNLLTVILGHTELAVLKMNSREPIIADLAEIRRAAERSAALTQQLLAFARKQTVAPKVLDLNAIVGDMTKMLVRLIGEDIHLVWQPAGSLWLVKIDPSQIDQILANLCVNARDAIKDIGKITIETGNSIFDEEYCSEHIGYLPGEYVMLTVSDNGCGMDRETVAHVFEPFFTTKALGEGTGLGLSTVYGIVKQNSGFINVYSEPGEGTTFRIYLPRNDDGSRPTKAELPVKPPERGQETILLVEDEQSILNLTKQMLELQGYNVLPANNPVEALERAESFTGEIHLLMTDVVMPGMNGKVLSSKLSLLRPKIKCLFSSGYTANVIAHHGVLDADVHFISKPFSLPELAAKVREVLDD